MKTVFIGGALGVLLIVSPFALADDHKDVPTQLQETIDRLALTDEQIDAVKPLLEGAAEKRDEILKKYGLDQASLENGAERPSRRSLRSMREEMNALSEENMEVLGAILTDEQIEEYKAIQSERQEEMRDRIRGKG